MAALVEEQVTDIRHWNETLFSFKTTRSDSFRFANGHFVMLGLRVDGKPLRDDSNLRYPHSNRSTFPLGSGHVDGHRPGLGAR